MSLPHFVPQSLPKMTAQQKFSANLAALRILYSMLGDGALIGDGEERADERRATEEERDALSRYMGWGATDVRKLAFKWDGEATPVFHDFLSEIGVRLEDGPQPDWLREMQRSVLNAHYTDISIVRVMWDVVMHLGFGELRAPRVLEPSCGVGHFIGCAPIDRADLLPERMVGVELDEVSALISRALYPRCDIRHEGFERADLPAVFDLVIGNVPFGDYQVAEPMRSGGVEQIPPQCCRQIHDYFLCRSVSLLRPGGVACLITSKGTLDKQDPRVRRWLAERADLVGAFRLPCDAFLENAGTEVTTDIVVLQRRGAA